MYSYLILGLNIRKSAFLLLRTGAFPKPKILDHQKDDPGHDPDSPAEITKPMYRSNSNKGPPILQLFRQPPVDTLLRLDIMTIHSPDHTRNHHHKKNQDQGLQGRSEHGISVLKDEVGKPKDHPDD